MSSPNFDLRDHVLRLLAGGWAHVGPDAVLSGVPATKRGTKPKGFPHTPWQLVEHMRIAQTDILEYCRDANHVSPDFPQGYWPEGEKPPSADAWSKSVQAFQNDLEQMRELVRDPAIDLLAQIPHGKQGHTVLREALVLANHNSYHLGQLVLLRKALGIWETK
jgi:hypothetical protein